MNLIRNILFKIEKNDEGSMYFNDPLEARHIAVLNDAGFLKAKCIELGDKGVCKAHVERLTCAGHDFLDAMRDNNIWNKAQNTILKPIGGVAFDVLLSWLKSEMSKHLGLS